ncbi:hypothetical protein CRG98_014504 [Punica granatum]|uniref:Uncharacterized protein n=1 Tax=Punica granatum TaxID=22663 RepID=A0A2I0K925_PUNGR|nr:hypothetical protein CRG98_014504 [Punica granatum]
MSPSCVTPLPELSHPALSLQQTLPITTYSNHAMDHLKLRELASPTSRSSPPLQATSQSVASALSSQDTTSTCTSVCRRPVSYIFNSSVSFRSDSGSQSDSGLWNLSRIGQFVRLIKVPIGGTNGLQVIFLARYSDEEFFRVRCKGSKEIYFPYYGLYGIDKIWRDDVLPCRIVLAANNLAGAAYDNFLDHTYLADRKTTIRKYLEISRSGIMEEEPPEFLKSCYHG